MTLLVHKYGGTSVGTVERIKAVADRVAATHAEGIQVIVVVSAMSGETNRLLALSRSFDNDVDPVFTDVLVSTGEQVTIGALAIALQARGVEAVPLCGWQVPIVTDTVAGKARIKHISTERLRDILHAGKVAIVAGFQGVSEAGMITTLGRGGSDTTAVALAAAMQADECQIYTDVDGVYTSDPRVVSDARRLDTVTFEEMLELASQGSKVLQIRSVEFAGKYKVPLRVLSSFKDGPGTLITVDKGEYKEMEQPVVSGIAFNRDEAKLTVRGVPDVPGAAYRILGPIGEANIEVDMIVQNVGADSTTDFTFTVHRADFDKARSILEETARSLGAGEVIGDDRIAKVSVVGVGMRSHANIASRMFQALGQEGVNMLMISTSEIKISVVVEEKYLELAVRCLHTAFGLHEEAGK
ncbi:MAG: aspartate kinase [Gammaproteobacteria bacterium]